MILKIFVQDLPATEGQGDGGAAHVQQGGQGDDGDDDDNDDDGIPGQVFPIIYVEDVAMLLIHSEGHLKIAHRSAETFISGQNSECCNGIITLFILKL